MTVQKRSNGHLQNRLLAALSPKAFSLFESGLRASTFKQGAIVQEAGEPVDQIYFPQTGMISLLVVTQEGVGIEAASDRTRRGGRIASRIGRATFIHASRHPGIWHNLLYFC